MRVLRQLSRTCGSSLGLVNLDLRGGETLMHLVGGGLRVVGSGEGVVDLRAGGVEFCLNLGMVQIGGECYPAGGAGAGAGAGAGLAATASMVAPGLSHSTSAGIALQRLGHDVVIYDQMRENRPVGAAL